MVDRQLALIPTDIDLKGPAAPLGSKNVVPNKGGQATKSIVSLNTTLTEKISHKNGDTNKKQVNHSTKSASKAKKAKVAMMKKFVTKIGTPENNIEHKISKSIKKKATVELKRKMGILS